MYAYMQIANDLPACIRPEQRLFGPAAPEACTGLHTACQLDNMSQATQRDAYQSTEIFRRSVAPKRASTAD